MRVYFDSVGCRLNQSEMDSLARRLAAAGGLVAGGPAQAEVVVLNTCAVTREAERDSRSAARRLHALSPRAQLVLTGCWATLAAGEAGALPGVCQVVTNEGKDSLLRLLAPDLRRAQRAPDTCPEGCQTVASSLRRRTRAFLKVQDGCDSHCTFCVTRLARGASRSRPLPDIVAEARALRAGGVKEIVLTGVQLGAYGRDGGLGSSLAHLLRALLDETDVPRLRLSSLEPWDLPASFFDMWGDPRLCPQLHLPLQSGAAGTLRRMARRTTPQAYAALVDAARSAIPDLALTTDVIVGFPGESDSEFEESLRFVERTQFAGVHAFRFSPRAGTPAARLGDRLPAHIVRERMGALRGVAEASADAFRRMLIGRTLPVLWERAPRASPAGPVWHGLTHNFQHVHCAARPGLANRILPTRLAALEGEIFVGHPAGPEGLSPVSQD